MTVSDQEQQKQKQAMQHEKNMVALSSVGAAIGLTALKLAVGLLTGSLGILAEAAHSGLDLIAALMTFFAVRFASRPADESHHYGHEKIENLSAFLEAVLLLVTALWIIYEAVRRLLYHEGHVEISIWAFVVMGISIVVDFTRSRVLLRVARKVGSQALEADALHFSTDIWSSAVVIIGLFIVLVTNALHLPAWLTQADAVAALVVSFIVIWVSVQLAKETLDALLDKAPHALILPITGHVRTLPEVLEIRRLRVRRAGNTYFIEITIAVARTLTFEQTHMVSEQVEDAVSQAVHEQAEQAEVDIVVHAEPMRSPGETIAERLYRLAESQGVHIHDIHLRAVGSHLEADVDLEVPTDLSLQEAHAQASRFEQTIVASEPQIQLVTTHLEAPETHVAVRNEVTSTYPQLVDAIRQRVDEKVGRERAHDIHLYCAQDEGGRAREDLTPEDMSQLDLTFHLIFQAHAPVSQVHIQAEEVKRDLRQRFPCLDTITLHMEPPEEDGGVN
ncbi:cation diffusion facilitator family transporter [Ktedonobacter robiniae]|nr:cation diffusion facilitator family transporter [Ktedonobacter robiniae]